MKTLSIDIETFSSVSLIDCGVYRYAASPDFEVLLFGYAFDDDPVRVIDLAQGEELPQEVLEALWDASVLKTAFNANFERACLGAALGRYMEPSHWSCTSVMARELGLPGSLEAAGAAIGLPPDKQKNKTGKALIRFFSIPCKPTKTNGGRTRNMPADDPERWAMYKDYNAQDVVTEREIRRKLSRFKTAPSEQKLWEIDQAINDRGVMVDTVLAEQAVGINDAIKAELYQQAQELTGLDNPKSTQQLKDWIEETTGVAVASLNKKVMGEVRKSVDDATVKRMLDIRASLSKTSTEKYKAMLRTVCPSDDRIRGLTQFYGAARTGRWAGRLVQMQNLPQNKIQHDELDVARILTRRGDLEALRLIFDDPASILSQLIRTAFVPRSGARFVVSDFSAIEARVLAWLADEDWRLETFKQGGDIYCASASQMFKVPVEKHGVNGHLRQKGKIAELALGYGGSVGALRSMGALDMGLEDSELMPLVKSWRAANKKVTAFWWLVDEAVRRCINTGGPQELPHNMALYREGPLMRLRLPSGRALSYVKPRIEDDSITYEGQIQKTNGWGRIESYGPKFVENIVQAVARDCLAESMFKLEAEKAPIVFHVHDEVICEVGPEWNAEKIAALMGEPIPWAPGLPLKADAYECNYYKKD